MDFWWRREEILLTRSVNSLIRIVQHNHIQREKDIYINIYIFIFVYKQILSFRYSYFEFPFHYLDSVIESNICHK